MRLLRKRGCEVRVVMTSSAREFISPLTFQTLSAHPVHTELLDAGQEQAMNHIHLARWAESLIIAPATANMIAKLAHGLADDLLSTLYLVAECPVLLAPAMNQAMWRKPVTQENIARLKQHGVQLIGPETGEQACGDMGLGRLADLETICSQLLGESQAKLLQGVNIMVTAGPTREPLDPVRFISNRSSGKMGYAIASAALNAGANVTLVTGPVSLVPPQKARLLAVETALQMHDSVMANIPNTDIFIGAAAVSDYRPLSIEERKIKKKNASRVIELLKNPDIIAEVANLDAKPFTIGFAAETNDLEGYALEKLHSKNLDMIAANWVGRPEGGFDSDNNALQVYWLGGQLTFPLSSKQQLAEQLVYLIAERFTSRNSS